VVEGRVQDRPTKWQTAGIERIQGNCGVVIRVCEDLWEHYFSPQK
jgi:hypothetical protein